MRGLDDFIRFEKVSNACLRCLVDLCSCDRGLLTGFSVACRVDCPLKEKKASRGLLVGVHGDSGFKGRPMIAFMAYRAHKVWVQGWRVPM